MWLLVMLMLPPAINCQEIKCDYGFSCRNRKCIPSRFYCNGNDDCGDGSDEVHLGGDVPPYAHGIVCRRHWDTKADDYAKNCLLPENQISKRELLCKIGDDCETGFLCENSKCIKRGWYCDGDNDCGDGSDEILFSKNTTISTGIACRQHASICFLRETQVIKSKLFCKKELDCRAGFLCPDGKCIDPRRFCDGFDDCGDGYDERQIHGNETNLKGIACRQHYVCLLPDSQASKRQLLCTKAIDCSDGFLCRNGKCIKSAYFCDGRDDCGDESDEVRICEHETTTDGISCRQHWDRQQVDDALICLLPTSQTFKSQLLCKIEVECSKGFLCENKKCINSKDFCDANDNCGDKSDEIPVRGNAINTDGKACRQFWDYQRYTSPNICLLRTSQISKSQLLCKKELDCGEGFLCNNGKCINPERFCTGYDDCGDGSDELRIYENKTNLEGIACHRHLTCLLPYSQSSKSRLLCTKELHCAYGFLCGNGECIQPIKFCNGITECPDGSDEIQVLKNATMRGGIACRQHWSTCLLRESEVAKKQLLCRKELDCSDGFLCENGKCISPSKFCNNVDDCGDNSDEILMDGNARNLEGIACRQLYVCHLPARQVSKRHLLCTKELNCSDGFLCESGECLEPTSFCNGIKECGDSFDEIPVDKNDLVDGIACRQHWGVCQLRGSQIAKDELLCTKDSNCNDGFKCGSGECIEPSRFCDGDLHCSDGSDELPQRTDGKQLTCLSRKSDFRCSLPDRYICDRTSHCMEGVDECLCSTDGMQVFPDEKCFRCLSKRSVVIPIARLCDGVFDCPDLTDECLCDSKQRPEICDKALWGQSGYFFIDFCTSNDFLKTLETAQICDSKKDCDNEIDERHCGSISTKNEFDANAYSGNVYYCASLRKHVGACDGRIDCRSEVEWEECHSCYDGKKSDFCGMFSDINSCSFPEGPSQASIHNEACDGTARCLNKVDELGCADWFYCKNGTESVFHVKRDKVCDKVDDCEDGSDEGNYQNCSYFICGDGGRIKYINSHQVCDGTIDYAEGSDECQDKCINSVFSDTKSMIKSEGAEIFVWFISLAAVAGNVAVIVFTVKDVYIDKRRRAQDPNINIKVINKMLILNLSVSDLIVGIYTFAVVIQNSMQKESYCLVDQDWRSSQTCAAIGSLLVIGSQQSVFMMIIITIFRVRSVKSTINFNPKIWKLGIVIIATWITSIALAVIPLSPYMEDQFIDSVWFKGSKLFTTIRNKRVHNLTNWLMLMYENSTEFSSIRGSWATLEALITKLNSTLTVGRKFGFYSTHAVCLPTFFPNTKIDTAWWYSLLLISINFVSFVVVFIGCVVIYRSATAQSYATNEAIIRNRSSSMQVKLTRIIITDFCCWMPVCTMGFFQLFGVDIPNEAYLPVALIVIPINSMLNPFLYSNVPDKIWAKAKEVHARRRWWWNTGENQTEAPYDQVIELSDM